MIEVPKNRTVYAIALAVILGFGGCDCFDKPSDRIDCGRVYAPLPGEVVDEEAAIEVDGEEVGG